MLTRLDLRKRRGELRTLLPRPALRGELPVAAVQAIVADVRERGDAAVLECTQRYDRVRLERLRVDQAALDEALAGLPGELRAALEVAHAAVEAFHRSELVPEREFVRDGVRVRELRRPVRRAGCYVPGGRARYPSTVLMTVVPAKVAGVPEVAVCVPPRPDGEVDPVTLAACSVAGADEVYRVGGAQAIAALAYGTESIRPVDVVVGPGNRYVTQAKREVAGVVGVPGAFAGPSEVVVVADDSTPPGLAAVDLAVQAEHGPDGLAWLVTWSPEAADATDAALAALVEESPRRAELEATLEHGGYAVVVDDPGAAIEVANAIAPEHLELLCAGAEGLLGLVEHAGAVFVGLDAPASVGDYLAGPSHVLPTFGTARFASALSVDDFVRRVHAVSLEAGALDRVGPHVAVLARAEGLPAHAASVELRHGARAGGHRAAAGPARAEEPAR
jgi:histidinol dehydrogenase